MRLNLKTTVLTTVLAIPLLSVSASPAAANQFYQQGFKDGMTYQAQSCQNYTQKQSAAIVQENQRLRQQIQLLQQQMLSSREYNQSGQYAGIPAPATNPAADSRDD